MGNYETKGGGLEQNWEVCAPGPGVKLPLCPGEREKPGFHRMLAWSL